MQEKEYLVKALEPAEQALDLGMPFGLTRKRPEIVRKEMFPEGVHWQHLEASSTLGLPRIRCHRSNTLR